MLKSLQLKRERICAERLREHGFVWLTVGLTLENDANPSFSRVRIYYLVTILLPDLYLTGVVGSQTPDASCKLMFGVFGRAC